jgi:prophage regulatory protein
MIDTPRSKLATIQNDRFLRWPEVKQRIGYSRSHVHLLIKQGKFPAPCKLGVRASAWLESSIYEWISERVSASQGNAQGSVKS